MSTSESKQSSKSSRPDSGSRGGFEGDSENPATESLVGSATQWADSTAQRVSTTIDLMAAEAKLAALSVTVILAISMFLALTLFATWGIAVALVMSMMIHSGMTFTIACSIMLVVHLFLALLSLLAINKVGQSISFRATRRQLKLQAQDSYELASAKA